MRALISPSLHTVHGQDERVFPSAKADIKPPTMFPGVWAKKDAHVQDVTTSTTALLQSSAEHAPPTV